MEPYSSLFLSNHVNRHDLKLALGSVHVRLYLYVTPFDPAKSLRVVDLPNLYWAFSARQSCSAAESPRSARLEP